MLDDVDELLDEIDEVLEENAEEFVKSMCKRASSSEHCSLLAAGVASTLLLFT
ncbi:ubiquitin-like protein Pup [Nitriliruptoraceae bacterium ZYF776]|nr:ubiquitin-like protein Pup [Profundirhabdus halotolerans]